MKRQGKTGVWVYVKQSFCILKEHVVIIAKCEWSNKQYEFHKEQWECLPIIK